MPQSKPRLSKHKNSKPKTSNREKIADIEITADFERFDQKNDVFRRSSWDERIRSDKSKRFYATYREPLTSWRRSDGFTQKDYSLRNAAWHVSDIYGIE